MNLIHKGRTIDESEPSLPLPERALSAPNPHAAELPIHPAYRYLERRGTMEDHWVVRFLRWESDDWIRCYIREIGGSRFELASLHRRVWQGAQSDPAQLSETDL